MGEWTPPDPRDWDALIAGTHAQLEQLGAEVRGGLDPLSWQAVRAEHRWSAENLRAYVGLRGRDLRDLQEALRQLGLSSLGRSEAHVLASLDAVEYALARMTGRAAVPPANRGDLARGRATLERNTARLLGAPANPQRRTRIMVTVPSEAIEDHLTLVEILDAGAELLRINTAHDDEAGWRTMVAVARRREAALGRPVRIAVDLAGPKLRVAGIRARGKQARKVRVAPGDVLRIVSERAWLADTPPAGSGAPPPALAPPAVWILVEEPAALRSAGAGERVVIDDGAVGSVITRAGQGWLDVEVRQTDPGGGAVACGKGVNLPDTPLALPFLSPADLAALDFVLECADIVSLSFVRSPGDVREFLQVLRERGGERLGVVLKIELVEAFRNLPGLLLALLEWECGGVMVARGDLAVEAGYLRLAELQEEVMWLSEAGHVPVIWATEVLDRMSKKGHPTRAEVTDAAMSSRAECVMLNKGPFISQSVAFLDSVLERMAEHQLKKSDLLRQLRSWS